MKKGLIILIILVLAIWAFVGRDGESEADMDTEHSHTPVSEDGVYNVEVSTSTLAWTGSKTFVEGYEDTGSIALSEGSLEVVDGRLAGGSFVVDMTTIQTVSTGLGSGSANLDKHLEREDFFSVEEYPEAMLVITDVVPAEDFTNMVDSDEEAEASEEEGDTKEAWDGVTYQVTGDLTIKGNTHPVLFIAEVYEGEAGAVVAEANIRIDRSKYDVRYGSGSFFDDLGDKAIDDIFTLDVMLVANPHSDMVEDDTEMMNEDGGKAESTEEVTEE